MQKIEHFRPDLSLGISGLRFGTSGGNQIRSHIDQRDHGRARGTRLTKGKFLFSRAAAENQHLLRFPATPESILCRAAQAGINFRTGMNGSMNTVYSVPEPHLLWRCIKGIRGKLDYAALSPRFLWDHRLTKCQNRRLASHNLLVSCSILTIIFL